MVNSASAPAVVEQPATALETVASSRWVIHHLDLSQPLPPLTAPPNCQGLYVVLWWRAIPLSHLELPAALLPLTVAQWLPQALAAIAPTVGSYQFEAEFQAPLPGAFNRWQTAKAPSVSDLTGLKKPLQQLEHQWEQNAAASAADTVSVIICTRDRPEHLARCLKSLRSLASPPYEVLVIDNAPTTEATQALVAQYPEVRYYREPRPGLSMARNTGIRQATGDLIAFTDDDVELHPHWFDQLRTAFRSPEVMAMTGLILPASLDTEAECLFQLSSSGFGCSYRPLTFDAYFFAEMKPYGVPAWRVGAGANMAFRREVFTHLGGFDERLGAGASGCSEDSEFWYRVLAAGWICQYQPTAVVFHHHRADFASLKQQMRAYMSGHVVALLVQAQRHGHKGNLRRLMVALPQYYAKQIIRGSLYRFKGKYGTIFTEIQGCLAGIGYYLRHYKVVQLPLFPKPGAQLADTNSATSLDY